MRIPKVYLWLSALFMLAATSAWLIFQYGDVTLRRMARTNIESQLQQLFRGALHIDRMAKLSLGSLRAEGVVVLDAQNRAVLRAKTVEIDFDLLALRKSKLSFTRLSIQDARVRMYPDPDAEISLFAAFLPRTVSSGKSDNSLAVELSDITLKKATVTGDTRDLTGLSLRDVGAHGQMVIQHGLLVSLDAISGVCEAPFAVPLTLEAATLRFDTEPLEMLGNFRVRHDEELLRAALRYVGSGDALYLNLDLSPLSTDTLRALDLGAPETLLGDLRGPIYVEGHGTDYYFRANLASAGGPLTIQGSRSSARRTSLHITTAEIDLSQLFAYVPPIVFGATVDVQAEPDGNVHISALSPAVNALGIELSQVRAAGDYKQGRLTLKETGFGYAGGHFDVTGYIDANADLKLRVRSLVPDLSRERALRQQGLRARLTTDLTVTQEAGLLAAEGRASLQGFAFSGVTADMLNVEGRASGDFLQPDLRIKARGQGVALAGYPVGDATLTAQGTGGVYQTDLSMVDALGRAATAKVRIEDRASSLHIVANPLTLSVPHREPWRAQADVVIDQDGVELRKVILDNGDQHLDTAGRFSYSRAYRVDANLVKFDLGGLRELIGIDIADLDGTVNGTLALTGVPGHPRIDAQASLTRGQFLGMQDLDAKLNMVFVEGRFDAQGEIVLPDESRLSVYAGGVPGRGRDFVDQVAAGTYQFGLDFERVPFEVSRPWLAWLGLTPPKGNISAILRGEGPLSAPNLDLTTHVEGLVLEPWPALDVDLSVTHDSKNLTLRALSVSDEHGEFGRALGSVEASLPELFDVEGLRRSLDVRPFELTLIHPARRLDSLPAPIRVDAPVTTSLNLEARQTPQGPAIIVQANAGFPTHSTGIDACGTARFPDLSISMEAQGDTASMKARGVLDAQPFIEASGKASVPVTGWITGSAPITYPKTALELSAHTEAAEDMPYLCRVVLGPIDVKVSAEDVFADPPLLTFQAHSPALQLVPSPGQRQRLGELKKMQTAGRPFAIDLRGGVEQDVVSFIGHIDEGGGSVLDAFVAVPRAAFDPKRKTKDLAPIEARLRMQNVELSRLLIALPTSLRAGATLNGDVRLAYDVDDDRVGLEGRIKLDDGRIAIATMGQELSEVEAELLLSGNRIQLTAFSARDFEGAIEAKGELRFDTLHHALAQLDFNLRDFPIRREGAQVSKLTGNLTLRADIETTRTRAELTVGDLRIDLPNELGQELQNLDPHPDIVVIGEEREPPPAEPYLFETRVIARNPPFRVRRTDLSAEVLADVMVRYREPILTIQGNAELKRGSFELYGKRFDLEESRMAFDGEDQLDPLVSLVAVHKIGADEIGVRLEGRLSAPTVTFTHSDPTITDTGEIIAQLLGGRSSDTSQTDQDATGAAASFLAGATAGLLTEEVRREFGGAIPVLAIESGNQAFRSARIRAGVQLDRLIEKRLGPLRNVVRGAYVEGFVAPGADPDAATQTSAPQSRGGGLLELRFPADFLGSVEYRPFQNWRIDVAWEP